ncbi:MAG: lipoprotein-releasing ABC transporter ATP-binding protein LolD [Gammaproteobacteria bacterium]|nr:lipoprotein-releasing ABC transporter ATP-binding protein LolD [Gammaproteobacteria bacterium]
MNLENIKPIISATTITKVFSEGKFRVEVLDRVSLEVRPGEMLAIVGPSGSGKSTLLHILGGLDDPTSGKVEINGVNIHELSEKDKSMVRNKYLGFVYQFHHLLPEFTALENVAMPLLIGNAKTHEAKDKAREILAAVGLEQREHHRIGELSGGERQRVAIARALVTSPKCVLADEPTGNLDHKTALQIYELIFKLKQDFNTAFVIVTHDLTIAHKMQRVLMLEDGRFV